MKNIENLTKNKLFLAPLAGFTDAPFRTICKICGADILTTEMVSSDGIVHNPSKSLPYAFLPEDQQPIGVQLFGNKPEIFAKALQMLPKMSFLSLNMGCPVKKVIKRGSGSALMKTPKLACEIVKTCKKICHSTPVIIKFRSGFDNLNFLEFGKLMESCGADALVLHPRMQTQMFSGHSNWEHIKKLKETVTIPVIGNGDIRGNQDIQKMKNQTNCDSVMIGRGAIGNPWIFDNRRVSSAQKLELIKYHYDLSINYYGKKKGVLLMRGHISKYTKGYKNSSQVREKINLCLDIEIIFFLLEKLFEK